jgi:hypothetical protein
MAWYKQCFNYVFFEKKWNEPLRGRSCWFISMFLFPLILNGSWQKNRFPFFTVKLVVQIYLCPCPVRCKL